MVVDYSKIEGVTNYGGRLLGVTNYGGRLFINRRSN